jgi:formylglycine-generating enzyme required for sulfatase activity
MGEDSPEVSNASPLQRGVRVSNFAIDAFEVTVARFRAWVTAGQPTPSGPVMYRGGPLAFEGTVLPAAALNPQAPCNWGVAGRENHPINCVNHATAQAFCVWDGGRLPTQAEWEFAARGSSGRVYPWGGEPGDTITNAYACWSGWDTLRESTCPVGSFGAGDTPDGVHDLAGNVEELNADWAAPYGSMAPGCWTDSQPTDPLCIDRMSRSHVVRNGSWADDHPTRLRAAARLPFLSTDRDRGAVGFRCARDRP